MKQRKSHFHLDLNYSLGVVCLMFAVQSMMMMTTMIFSFYAHLKQVLSQHSESLLKYLQHIYQILKSKIRRNGFHSWQDKTNNNDDAKMNLHITFFPECLFFFL